MRISIAAYFFTTKAQNTAKAQKRKVMQKEGVGNFRVKIKAGLLILVAVLALIVFHRQIIIFIAKKQIQNVFLGSEVSIGECRLFPQNALIFNNVEIKKENTYFFKLKEIRIDYTPPSLFKKTIKQLTLNDLAITVSSPQENILDLTKYIKYGSSGLFNVQLVKIDSSTIDLNTKYISMRASASLIFDMERQKMLEGKIFLDSLALGELNIEEASFTTPSDAPAFFMVKQARYNKIKLEDIQGNIGVRQGKISLAQINARLFGGTINGDIVLSFSAPFNYAVKLAFYNLDAGKIAEDLELKEKFEMTGHWRGRLQCYGEGIDVRSFDGDFSALAPGGKLTITDKKFLQDMAIRTQTPADILVERFTDYHYNKGITDLSITDGTLALGILLEGEKGRSNLKINVHDFINTVLNLSKNNNSKN
ncbi:MAG: YdbH domain-containing protein [Candidatus Omnitrophica bacterium]|nr:YdbH domain-containing protein [Candidatus Omnitrophota bacterium]